MNLKSIICGLSAVVMSAAALVSCNKEAGNESLTVDPASSITFNAKDNADVKLNVTTTAAEWNFSAPEWVVATKEGNVLSVNVNENASKDSRVGRIVVTAGSAVPAKIGIFQRGEGAIDGETGGVAVTVVNKSGSEQIFTKGGEMVVSIAATIAEAASEDVVVSVALDPRYLEEYNFIKNEHYELFPEEGVTFPATELTIPAGSTESEQMDITLDANALGFGTGYLVPIMISSKTNSSVAMDTKRVNFVILKQREREIKNVLYFEVNDVNPLNALEYVLEDGTPFFDAIILFAANINYNQATDRVYLHNNPNVQALLDESDVYIQPLRKKGIKVYLGLLGNHDAAGLCQLSDWGAAEWAKEVAAACREYKLDGVNLDDEYSGDPIIGNKWFAHHSAQAGSRLAYELKKAMKKECYWPTEVSYFAWGALYTLNAVKDQETGEEHQPGEFLDFYVSNYGSASYPYADLTKKQCSAQSFELNRKYGSLSVETARGYKEAGFGWCMWFAFNPQPGSHTENLRHSMNLFRGAAEGFYNQKLMEPKGYYKKVGEGQYDSKLYSF